MKYFIGVLVILFFVIVGVLLFTGGDDAPEVLTQQDTTLAQYADQPDSRVMWMQQGKVVAEEEHYRVRITVTSSARTVEVLHGYEERVVRRETFPNTQEAYRVFLDSIDNLGFDRSKDAAYDDVAGACPTGFRYLYKLESSMETVVDTWSTSCAKSDGNFDGNAATIRRLFRAQIPEYNEITDVAKL